MMMNSLHSGTKGTKNLHPRYLHPTTEEQEELMKLFFEVVEEVVDSKEESEDNTAEEAKLIKE